MATKGVRAKRSEVLHEHCQQFLAPKRLRRRLVIDKAGTDFKLKPEEQQAVRDVTRILGSEFLSNVRANKGLLGVNPTDNDARLLQAPMATTDDSSRAVQLWARQQVLLNKQREALYSAYQQHADAASRL
jgi:hypothetical protein